MDPRCIEGLCFCLYLPVACSLAFPIPQEVEVAGLSPNKAQALLWKSLGATHPTPQVGKGVFVGFWGVGITLQLGAGPILRHWLRVTRVTSEAARQACCGTLGTFELKPALRASLEADATEMEALAQQITTITQASQRRRDLQAMNGVAPGPHEPPGSVLSGVPP